VSSHKFRLNQVLVSGRVSGRRGVRGKPLIGHLAHLTTFQLRDFPRSSSYSSFHTSGEWRVTSKKNLRALRRVEGWWYRGGVNPDFSPTKRVRELIH